LCERMNRVMVLVAMVACAAFAVTNTTMPSYYAVGSTAYKLGISIGVQQKDAFAELLKADDSLRTRLEPWMNEHPEDFEKFYTANKAAYPEIFDEVLGIAEGAGLKANDTVLLMLRPEIESLTSNYSADYTHYNENCFDIINNPADKTGTAFIAHNEDWTPAYKPFGFVLHENMPFSKTGATHITAFTYPASPVGFTFGYNDKGLVTSCNGLNPIPCTPGKLGRYFINRDVLAATSVQDAIDRLTKAAPESALGFAMSIGCVHSHELYHAEMAPYNPNNKTSKQGYVDIIPIKPGESYLHSNKYTHPFFKDIKQFVSNSTAHRLDRAGKMTTPSTPKLALAILGDETDKDFPIYRYGRKDDELATISTAVLDLDNALVTIYGGNPTQYDPVVVMPLFNPHPGGSGEDSSDKNTVGWQFWVAAAAAGFLALIVIILAIALVAQCKHNSGNNTLNSSYHRVV